MYPVPAHLGAPGVDLLGQRAQCRAAGDRRAADEPRPLGAGLWRRAPGERHPPGGPGPVAAQMADLCVQLHEDTGDIMQLLGEAAESRDQYTSGHVEEVA